VTDYYLDASALVKHYTDEPGSTCRRGSVSGFDILLFDIQPQSPGIGSFALTTGR